MKSALQQCPLLALSRHANSVVGCPLSGVKQTSAGETTKQKAPNDAAASLTVIFYAAVAADFTTESKRSLEKYFCSNSAAGMGRLK
jgi:hypothetical protein